MRHSLFAALVLCLSISYAQNVWIADNNPNAPTGANIFPTIQEAIDAAIAGDTIYVQPSNTTYGIGTTLIELHFRGIGFNLDKDVPYTSNVSDLRLYGAADGSTNSSGSSVSGLNITTLRLGRAASNDQNYTQSGLRIFNNIIGSLSYINQSFVVPIDDMVLAYNRLTTVIFSESVTNSTIRNNVVDNYVNFAGNQPIQTIVANNIISGYLQKNSIDDNLVVQNNIFIGNGSTSALAFQSRMENAIISNNIFYGSIPSITNGGNSTSANFENNVFNNNITFSTGNNQMPPLGGGVGNTGNGNFENVDPQFANATLGTTWQSTDDFTVSAPEALNGGTDATDIGISGGPYPFGTPNLQLETSSIPTIQSLNVSSVINVGQDLQVDVSAKSN